MTISARAATKCQFGEHWHVAPKQLVLVLARLQGTAATTTTFSQPVLHKNAALHCHIAAEPAPAEVCQDGGLIVVVLDEYQYRDRQL